MNVLPAPGHFASNVFLMAWLRNSRLASVSAEIVRGIDFWETWSPIVQWSTVRLMMTLAAKLDLCSSQADITAAFVHAELEPGEQIFVCQPAGFQREGDLVLSLKRTVYGQRQTPRSFFCYLTRSLTSHGLVQSDLDPCLFIGKDVIVIVYVDDLFFLFQVHGCH